MRVGPEKVVQVKPTTHISCFGGYILKHILGVMKFWCWVEVPQNLRQPPDMTIDWDVMHQRNHTH